ncbi:MAG: endonuclease NucS [Candidatus Bathyarchaeota archaeon]|nr:MAG: endonuclease NucS [Candidatus Bathyarchaeota archaeon]
MPKKEDFAVLYSPDVEEAGEVVRRALSARRVLLITGNCWVDYKGRASSKLEPGERIVVIKEDGSVMVHRPTGYEPVNWQPPGCVFQTSVDGDVLQIRAIRRRPSESVSLFFDRIFLVSAQSLVDTGSFSLFASEEDMQRAIVAEPSLLEPDFKPITYEKKVEPGFIDVYGIDGDGRFVVVEIKRRTAGRQAALQLARYVDSVKETVNREVRGLLVAPYLGKGVQRLLETLKLEFKALSPKRCAEVLTRSETKKLADFFKEDGESL